MTVRELTIIFGKNIRNRRIICGFSQEKLAEMIGVSINTVCEIETGKKFVRAETLIRFASVLNTEVYELFKPDNVSPDNAYEILTKYSYEIKEAVDSIRNNYLK